jgi:hypothetical protein
MSNNVDEKSVIDLSSGAVDCLIRSLENLLETQMSSLEIRDEGKRKMARQHLLAAYVDVAKSLQMHELEKYTEEIVLVGEATKKISEMRAKL